MNGDLPHLINSTVRVHGRGKLLSILEKAVILARIKVGDNGYFIAETVEWNSYWAPLYELRNSDVEKKLNALHSVWLEYIHSGLEPSWRQKYCYCYFSLLDVVLSRHSDNSNSDNQALWSILGFECFGIIYNSNTEVNAAGISSLRNPCYLLAKLKMPDVMDDPQFLPIITVRTSGQPELFYHYRQYTLSIGSPISIFLYLAVSEEKRSESFRIINKLAGSIRYAADPWTTERAEQIYRGVISKIIQIAQTIGAGIPSLEFVDVGAGSGSLSSRLCQYIQKKCSFLGSAPQFRLWFIDLELADPCRYFRVKKRNGLVDSLIYLGDDYRNWLSQPQPLPPPNGLRIALISKLFNVFSRFSISYLSCEDISATLSSSKLELCDPCVCLAPDSTGARGLMISNSRSILPEGKAYIQASFSNFYRGLFLISTPTSSHKLPSKGLFYPVRVFNPECMVTLNGNSVISLLIENCSYIIIEDADLRPQDLIDHVIKFSLRDITIYDMTKALKLKGNYLYLIGLKQGMSLPFSGAQIW
jgi:hypothetical protein